MRRPSPAVVITPVLIGLAWLGPGLAAPSAQAATPALSAPTAVRVSPGNGTAKITWKPPAHTGGAKIAGYVVQRSSGTKWRTVKTLGAAKRTLTVRGLKNGTKYSFRVEAKNRAGRLHASAKKAVTPRRPSACTARTAPASASTSRRRPTPARRR